MAGSLLEFTDANFQSEVLESQGVVLVDFWAPWCGPCLKLTPTIEALAAEYAGKAKIGKLNTDDNYKTASAFAISSIPTVVVFKDGKPVEKLVGMNPKGSYSQVLDKLAGA
jgi:thioredoxin 1